MKQLFKCIFFAFWLTVIIIFLKYQLYINGISKITGFLSVYHQYSILLFLLIATFRIFTFVPCTVFIIIAGMFFDPLETVVLTTVSNLLSEILLYFFAKFTLGMAYQDKVIKKYPRLYGIVEKNCVQILALGVSSPVVPSDVVCFFSILTGISLKKYISTIFVADTPIILLYTFLGNSVKYSIIVFLITLIIIFICSYFNYKKWNNQINS